MRHSTSGIADKCAPSTNSWLFSSIAGLATLLKRGNIVTATDYQGPGGPGPHPYLVGASAAHSVLDIGRAAREVPQATALLCGASRKDVTRLSGLLNSQRATPLSCSSWVRQRHQSSQLAPAESHCELSQTASNRISLSSFDSEVKQRLGAVGVRTMFVMRKR